MSIKKQIPFLLFVLLLAACTDEEKQPDSKAEGTMDAIVLDSDNTAYLSWDEYYSKNDIHFSIDSFIANDTINAELLIRSVDLSDDFYNLYGRLIEYNDDSSKFIDPFSYSLIMENENGKLIARGGEVDHEVTVVDIKTKTSTRLLFCGPSCEIQKAFWYNENIVGIMGLTSEYSDEYFTPVIWFVNIKNGLMIPYYYNSTVSLEETEDYLEKYLNSKGIEYEN
ncbi:MAG: hypothetical protein H6551_10970 [Chitinophagales bacterium]|nr:hypothetical protein [Chitinophagaceae bacterium]MCB9065647.1 hypothetical protein [Chitinophagales bacterium]